jgi:hypothetical protein
MVLTDTDGNSVAFQFVRGPEHTYGTAPAVPTVANGKVQVPTHLAPGFGTATAKFVAKKLFLAVNAFTASFGLGRLHITASMSLDEQSVLLHQIVPGDAGNTTIKTNYTGSAPGSGENDESNMDEQFVIVQFNDGTGPYTAKRYGSEKPGTINAANYEITGSDGFGDASKHKYHRNNLERIKFIGDDIGIPTAVYYTASVYDNAFISHMIPRTDQQTRWITASLI